MRDPLQEIENACDRGIDVDRVPDGVFRKVNPSAQDSYKFGINLGKR